MIERKSGWTSDDKWNWQIQVCKTVHQKYSPVNVVWSPDPNN